MHCHIGYAIISSMSAQAKNFKYCNLQYVPDKVRHAVAQPRMTLLLIVPQIISVQCQHVSLYKSYSVAFMISTATS